MGSGGSDNGKGKCAHMGLRTRFGIGNLGKTYVKAVGNINIVV